MSAVKEAINKEVGSLLQDIGIDYNYMAHETQTLYEGTSNLKSYLEHITSSLNSQIIPSKKNESSTSLNASSYLSNANSYLKESIDKLKPIQPANIYSSQGENNPKDHIKILEFKLVKDFITIEDFINTKLGNEDKRESNSKEVYSIKVEYSGNEDLEKVQVMFASDSNEIPLFTIEKLVPHQKSDFYFSIPFDFFYTAQCGLIYLKHGDSNLDSLEVYPVKIEEVILVNNKLQVKIRSYLGCNLEVIIVDMLSNQAIEAELVSGNDSCYVFDMDKGEFCVYAGGFIRSNIWEFR